jgi:putative membrane protein
MPAPPDETLRLHQANERTFLAWIRTGIAVMAFGFAIARFGVFLRQMAALDPARVGAAHGLGSTWIGVVLVALGTLANALATFRYAHVRRAIERGDLGAPSAALVIAVGATATLLGVGMGVLLTASLAD